MTDMVMAIPDPGQVALVVSDGKRWAAAHVSREALEREPARAIAEAMAGLEGTMVRLEQDEITDESELRHWREADVMRTPRGYALSPAAIDELMRKSLVDEYREGQDGDDHRSGSN